MGTAARQQKKTFSVAADLRGFAGQNLSSDFLGENRWDTVDGPHEFPLDMVQGLKVSPSLEWSAENSKNLSELLLMITVHLPQSI